MKPIYLERHDPDQNLHRFYQLHVTPGLFDDWSLVKEWGSVGSPGTVRKDWFETDAKALTVRQLVVDAKRKKGYQSIFVILAAKNKEGLYIKGIRAEVI